MFAGVMIRHFTLDKVLLLYHRIRVQRLSDPHLQVLQMIPGHRVGDAGEVGGDFGLQEEDVGADEGEGVGFGLVGFGG